jgi:pyridinium-3,5-bisthiocarboxylic acid mononucleotide nickel chelatase
MKTAYFDCFSGISGDMILGALIDAGLDADRLRAELAKLPLSGYEITAERVLKNGIYGTRFSVKVAPQRHHRSLTDIMKILDDSGLADGVRRRAAAIFTKIAEVEAAIHGVPVEEVHFHEIGAIDSIIDVTGACVALDLMGIGAVYASRINTGEGFVETAHGTLPVPAPATAALLTGVPVYSSGIRAELATPTGAAIIAHTAQGFGPMPEMTIERAGYGAGYKDLPVPNLLRVFIGKSGPSAAYESVIAIETNIDDMNPEFYQHASERLLESGALDVFTTQVIMKKSRPGVMLTVLCREESRDTLSRIIFEETTTAGLRYNRMERMVLDREGRRVMTPFGEIGVKVMTSAGRIITMSPEYEECRRIARANNVPLKQVYDEARKAAGSLMKK